VVAGGGITLLNATKVLDALKLEGDEATGVRIVRRALEEPIRQLAVNAGLEGSLIAQEVLAAPKNKGYDFAEGKIVDMFEAGIIDPAKVTRSGLQNAGSIAGLLLTTEAVVTEVPEKDEATAGAGMHGDEY